MTGTTVGRGAVYTRGFDGTPLRDEPAPGWPAMRAALIARHFIPYHARIERFADRIRYDEAAHAEGKRAPDDAGPNRSGFLALDPAPGVPILEHKRLRKVVDELPAFLEKVRIAGFTLEL